MKRAEMLKSMAMPKKAMANEEADLDLDMLAEEAEESPEDEAAESPEKQKMEDEMGIEMHEGPLEDISDDDLIAEMKKRGLIEGDELAEVEPVEEMEEVEEEIPAPKKPKKA